jgi:hypothetical protein
VSFGTVPGNEKKDEAVAEAEPLIPIDQRGTPPVPLPRPTLGKVRR